MQNTFTFQYKDLIVQGLWKNTYTNYIIISFNVIKLYLL